MFELLREAVTKHQISKHILEKFLIIFTTRFAFLEFPALQTLNLRLSEDFSSIDGLKNFFSPSDFVQIQTRFSNPLRTMAFVLDELDENFLGHEQEVKELIVFLREAYCGWHHGFFIPPFYTDINYISAILGKPSIDFPHSMQYMFCPTTPECVHLHNCPQHALDLQIEIFEPSSPIARRKVARIPNPLIPGLEHDTPLFQRPTIFTPSDEQTFKSKLFQPSEDIEDLFKSSQSQTHVLSPISPSSSPLSQSHSPKTLFSPSTSYVRPIQYPAAFACPYIKVPAIENDLMNMSDSRLSSFFNPKNQLGLEIIRIIDSFQNKMASDMSGASQSSSTQNPVQLEDYNLNRLPPSHDQVFGYDIYSEYNREFNSFILVVLSNLNPNIPLDESFEGATLAVRPACYIFVIKNIPLWNCFLDCECGLFKIARGSELVVVHEERSRGLKTHEQARQQFLSNLQRRGFFSISIFPDIQSDPLLFAKFRGLNVRLLEVCETDQNAQAYFKSLYPTNPIPDIKNNIFLDVLMHYLIEFVVDHVFKVYDIKPSNILWQPPTKHTAQFTVIDYYDSKDQTAGYKIPMICFAQYHKNITAQIPTGPIQAMVLESEQSQAEYRLNQRLFDIADNIVFTIFEISDNNLDLLQMVHKSCSNLRRYERLGQMQIYAISIDPKESKRRSKPDDWTKKWQFQLQSTEAKRAMGERETTPPHPTLHQNHVFPVVYVLSKLFIFMGETIQYIQTNASAIPKTRRQPPTTPSSRSSSSEADDDDK